MSRIIINGTRTPEMIVREHLAREEERRRGGDGRNPPPPPPPPPPPTGTAASPTIDHLILRDLPFLYSH